MYSYNFPNDRKRLKLLGTQTSPALFPSTTDNSDVVSTVFLLETLQTVLCGVDLFYWFASGYGDVTRLTSPFASPFDIPILESTVAFMVQNFYAYRVWVLSNKKAWWLCLLICLVCRSQAHPIMPLFDALSLLVLHSQRGGRIHRRYLC